MYFRYCNQKEIAETLGMTQQAVSVYLSRRPDWKEQRETMLAEIGELAVQRNIVEVNEIFRYGLPLIKASLKARAEENNPLTITEAKQVTEIMTAFDKLMRLEAGKPTDIQKDIKPVTLAELKQVILREDDFIQLEVKDVGSDQGEGSGDSPANRTPQQDEGRAHQSGSGA